MIKKTIAFTLSEVLITMTVIGVVAALTIPTLHYNRMKREYSVKLKTFYSKISNAVIDMEAAKGPASDMKFPTQRGFEWYLENIDPYVGHQYVDSTNKTIYYKDGSKIGTFWTGASAEARSSCLDVSYDVNGDKGPNRLGYDIYRFLFCFEPEQRKQLFGNENSLFGTYGAGLVSPDTTREQMIEKCADSESSTQCSRLLQNDQWEFKKDYPYKF